MCETPPSWRRMIGVFGRVGLLSFGGPAAQIGLLHREVVEGQRWIPERDYLAALSFCMLLPGPEAMQLATWCGWRLRGTPGGLLAGALFVLPGAVLMLALAAAYVLWGQQPLVGAAFLGIKAVVLVVVIEALLRLSARALPGRAEKCLAVLAFLALFALGLPFAAVVLAAALWGLMQPAATAPQPGSTTARPRIAGSLGTAALWALVWLLPLWAVGLMHPVLAQIGWLFSVLAVVGFGGAYAVLSAMSRITVDDYGWLTEPQMVDGLGLAEATPGPLILVAEFVGFLGAHGAGGMGLGVLGAVVAVWATFLPSFLYIFVAAPWMGRILAVPRLAAALRAISAAIVGVIANLSLWFAAHVLFDRVGRLGPMILPDPASLDLTALGLTLAAALLLRRAGLSLLPVMALAALAGLALAALPLPGL